MLNTEELYTLYYLSLFDFDVNYGSGSLAQPIRELFIEIIAEEEVQWLQEAPFSEVYNYIAYDGFSAINEWEDKHLINKLIDDPDAYLRTLIAKNFKAVLTEALTSVELITLSDLFHDRVMHSLDYLESEEIDLLMQRAS